MTADGRIPIVIGVTGHHALLSEYREPLRKAVREALVSLREKYPHSPLLLRTLASEKLVENGNWCSCRRDNAPDISL